MNVTSLLPRNVVDQVVTLNLNTTTLSTTRTTRISTTTTTRTSNMATAVIEMNMTNKWNMFEEKEEMNVTEEQMDVMNVMKEELNEEIDEIIWSIFGVSVFVFLVS